MSLTVRIFFLITFFFALTGKALAYPQAYDGEDFEVLVDPEEYEAEDEPSYIPPYLWKRGGFWASHPSDFNPMRRPSSGTSQNPPRNSKKSEPTPYHPVPRTVNQNLKNQQRRSVGDDYEAIMEGLRDKRQSPGSFLLMKLGKMSKNNAGTSGDLKGRLGRRRA